METNYSYYNIEIKNAPFLTPNNIQTPKTAIIFFCNDRGEIINFREYGYYETKDIYDKIENNKEINLDNCYVKNFSLKAYRLYTLQDPKTMIELKNFSAKNAFFDSKYSIDFSFCIFKNDNVVSFENTHFASGKVIFASSIFNSKGVFFSYAFFRDGNADFSKVHFNEGETQFKNAIFNKGEKDFQYTIFGKGTVSFINTQFGDGDTLFINTIFEGGDISFKVANFGDGKKDFRYAKFGKGELSFDRTQFGNGLIDFRTVEIETEKVIFSRSIFGKSDVLFEAIEIKNSRVNFKNAEFGEGIVNFNLAECSNTKIFFDRSYFGSGSLTFYNSKFNTLSLKSCHLDYYIDLRMAECQLLDLSDSIIRDIVDIKPFDFNVKINSVNFEGIRLIGRIYIDWNKNRVKELITQQSDASLSSIAEQFRVLKQNFNVTGQYNDEDKAYVEFKRFESKSILKEAVKQKKWNSIWAYPSYWFKWLVFDKMGLYATSPTRVFISVICVWFLFGCLYYFLEISGLGKTFSSVGNPDKISILAQSFYHSAITFFTIGYGDVFPEKLTRLFSAIEGFTGVFMMSYFTVAFVRKILR
jgi:hypothetical protein